MAGENVDRPHGFKPLRRQGGGTISVNPYTLAAANARIRKYDVLVATDAGVVDCASTSADPFVGAAPIVGIAAQDAAASAGGTILVYDDPDLVMEAQCDNGTTLTQTGLNLNYDIISTATTTQVNSIMEIDSSSGVTTAATPLKALRVYPLPDNVIGEFVRLEVIWSQHQARSSSGSVGV